MNQFTIKANQANEIGFVLRAKNLSETPDIRFVIHAQDHDVSVHCKGSTDDDRWTAVIPPLNLTESEVRFDIEVISEEFYFKPTSGTIKIIKTPDFEVGGITAPKPTVSVEIQESTVTRRTLVEYADMGDDTKKNFTRSVKSSAKILETASNVLKSLAVEGKITSKGILAITEASKNAITNLENQVWKK